MSFSGPNSLSAACVRMRRRLLERYTWRKWWHVDDRASAESIEGSERKIWVMISVGSVSKYIVVVVTGAGVLW